MAQATLRFVLLLAGVAVCFGDFGYDPEDVLGPERWAEEYQSCGGKYQSPIDIEESLVTRVYMKPLKFYGIDELPYSSVFKNTGHTVQVTINNPEPIIVSGGPLTSNYTFEQLHFHWGANDSVGSEDTINNHSYSMELHMVFFKSEYGKIQTAWNFKDGLAVLAIFFEISKLENKVYAELVDSLSRVEWPNTEAELRYQFPLVFMLPKQYEHYFTYHGSLTTPPCLEVVTWIEFKHPVLLSHNQLATFRRLRSFDGFLTHNVRPVQPLHGRSVLYNAGFHENKGSVVESGRTVWISLIFIQVFKSLGNYFQ